MTFAVIFVTFFNIRAAYGDPTEFFSAIGHYLICISLILCHSCSRLVHFQRNLDGQHDSFIDSGFRPILYSDNGVPDTRDWILQ